MERLDDFLKTVKEQEIVNLAKANEIIGNIKAADFLKKKEEEERRCNTVAIVITVILSIVAICAIAYALYLYFAPDQLDDFEDDWEDDEYEPDFEDEFFEPDEK